MKKINTNLLFSLLAIIFFFFSFKAYAQTDEASINIPDAQKSTIETVNTANGVEDPYEYNSARSQAINATTAVSNAIIFLDPTITSGWEEIENSENITNDMKNGLYGMTRGSVVSMYESQPYVNVYAHLANEWVPGHGETASVYAETDTGPYDSGYEELLNSGIVGLWTQVRNITYVFFMIIFIIVGFMIMFRSKIGGQTLITLGNSLPNIILALIGVTFSFAIAGLIIDVGGVIMVLLVDIFEGNSNFSSLVTLDSFGNIFKTFGSIFDFDITNPEGKGFLSFLGSGSIVALFLPGVGTTIGIIGLVIVLAILGVITVGTFKVFISLIKAYLGILFNVITGPFQIAISAIPGKNNNFMNWMKSILRNVLVYPITFAILNLPGVIYNLNGEGGLSLPGPDKLTLPQTANQVGQSTDFIGGFMIFILQILVLFAASNADKYVQAIIPPTTTKEGSMAMEAAKKGMQGIPLIGKLIK